MSWFDRETGIMTPLNDAPGRRRAKKLLQIFGAGLNLQRPYAGPRKAFKDPNPYREGSLLFYHFLRNRKPCSCDMCSNERKTYGHVTRQEQRAEMKMREE
jgi:hypothetical protein